MTQQLPNGVYSAIVTERSVDVPSPADAITYTVKVNMESGSVPFPGVSPHPSKRWTSYMPVDVNGELPNLNPFPIGTPVILHVQRLGESRAQVFIGEGEVPAFGGCE